MILASTSLGPPAPPTCATAATTVFACGSCACVAVVCASSEAAAEEAAAASAAPRLACNSEGSIGSSTDPYDTTTKYSASRAMVVLQSGPRKSGLHQWWWQRRQGRAMLGCERIPTDGLAATRIQFARLATRVLAISARSCLSHPSLTQCVASACLPLEVVRSCRRCRSAAAGRRFSSTSDEATNPETTRARGDTCTKTEQKGRKIYKFTIYYIITQSFTGGSSLLVSVNVHCGRSAACLLQSRTACCLLQHTQPGGQASPQQRGEYTSVYTSGVLFACCAPARSLTQSAQHASSVVPPPPPP